MDEENNAEKQKIEKAGEENGNNEPKKEENAEGPAPERRDSEISITFSDLSASDRSEKAEKAVDQKMKAEKGSNESKNDQEVSAPERRDSESSSDSFQKIVSSPDLSERAMELEKQVVETLSNPGSGSEDQKANEEQEVQVQDVSEVNENDQNLKENDSAELKIEEDSESSSASFQNIASSPDLSEKVMELEKEGSGSEDQKPNGVQESESTSTVVVVAKEIKNQEKDQDKDQKLVNPVTPNPAEKKGNWIRDFENQRKEIRRGGAFRGVVSRPMNIGNRNNDSKNSKLPVASSTNQSGSNRQGSSSPPRNAAPEEPYRKPPRANGPTNKQNHLKKDKSRSPPRTGQSKDQGRNLPKPKSPLQSNGPSKNQNNKNQNRNRQRSQSRSPPRTGQSPDQNQDHNRMKPTEDKVPDNKNQVDEWATGNNWENPQNTWNSYNDPYFGDGYACENNKVVQDSKSPPQKDLGRRNSRSPIRQGGRQNFNRPPAASGTRGNQSSNQDQGAGARQNLRSPRKLSNSPPRYGRQHYNGPRKPSRSPPRQNQNSNRDQEAFGGSSRGQVVRQNSTSPIRNGQGGRQNFNGLSGPSGPRQNQNANQDQRGNGNQHSGASGARENSRSPIRNDQRFNQRSNQDQGSYGPPSRGPGPRQDSPSPMRNGQGGRQNFNGPPAPTGSRSNFGSPPRQNQRPNQDQSHNRGPTWGQLVRQNSRNSLHHDQEGRQQFNGPPAPSGPPQNQNVNQDQRSYGPPSRGPGARQSSPSPIRNDHGRQQHYNGPPSVSGNRWNSRSPPRPNARFNQDQGSYGAPPRDRQPSRSPPRRPRSPENQNQNQWENREDRHVNCPCSKCPDRFFPPLPVRDNQREDRFESNNRQRSYSPENRYQWELLERIRRLENELIRKQDRPMDRYPDEERDRRPESRHSNDLPMNRRSQDFTRGQEDRRSVRGSVCESMGFGGDRRQQDPQRPENHLQNRREENRNPENRRGAPRQNQPPIKAFNFGEAHVKISEMLIDTTTILSDVFNDLFHLINSRAVSEACWAAGYKNSKLNDVTEYLCKAKEEKPKMVFYKEVLDTLRQVLRDEKDSKTVVIWTERIVYYASE